MIIETFILLQIFFAIVSVGFCIEAYYMGRSHEREEWQEWLRRQQ
jgi:hypothetical protein